MINGSFCIPYLLFSILFKAIVFYLADQCNSVISMTANKMMLFDGCVVKALCGGLNMLNVCCSALLTATSRSMEIDLQHF